MAKLVSPRFISLSTSYFFYFSVLGLVVPFMTLYLDGKGFSSLEIGELTAIFLATKIIGPGIWASIADNTGQQLTIIRLGAFLALLFFMGLFVVDGFWLIALVLALFSLFWTAILPQLEVMTLNSVRHQAKVYARIRLWGSIGFIVIAILGAELIEQFSSQVFPYIGATILLGLYLSTLINKQPKSYRKTTKALTSIAQQLMDKNFVLFFLAGLLLQISFGPYYTFFALYLQSLNYSGLVIGLLIAFGVVAEIVIFIYAGKIFKAFSVKTILVFSMFVTALRWALIGGQAQSLILLLAAQVIHAASFGLYHSASMLFIHRHFLKQQQGRGQAIYISGVYGLGGALGAYYAGAIWQEGAGDQLSFYSAAVMVFLAGLLLMIGLKEKREPVTE